MKAIIPTIRRQESQSGFNVSAWSIQHPWVVLSFYAAILALAAMAIFGGVMPRRMMPYVESPMVGIVTMMPGLSAQEMETYLSKPIEERMTDIRGARYIRSTSQDGLSIVSLEFPYGTDMKRAITDVQALMNAVQADLPQTGANLKPSWVLPIDPLNIPVLSLSVTGDSAQGWTPLSLREFAENEGVRAIKQVGDVQSVMVYGGQKRQLRVEINRDKLAAYGYSILDVRDAIDKHSTAKPAGVVTSGPNETIVRVADLAQDAQTVADYPLGAKNGQIVYLRDVASVSDDFREQRSGYNFVDGERKVVEGIDDSAVEMAVIQNPAASSIPVIAAVQKQIATLEQDHPGLHFKVAYDNAHFVNILFKNTGEELVTAIVLCGIAVLFFLGSGRGTIISLVTIPVSMAMAILLMVPFGFSLNSSTLIGLLVSIGRLVDDSLIDIHAVERHLAMGKDPKTATVDGITEVRLAVAASTIMLVLALSPLLFCGGITQIMFVGLVYPILFGLIASFFVSLSLTALLSAYLLKPHGSTIVSPPDRGLKPTAGRPLANDPPGRGYLKINKYRKSVPARVLGGEAVALPWVSTRGMMGSLQTRLDRMDSWYQRLVLLLLRHKFSVVAAAIATIIVGFGFYNFIGSEMMPLADVGQAYGVLEMRPGASYAETKEATAQIERILLKHPEIRRVSTEIGEEPGGTYFTGYAMSEVNSATMMITLSDKDERAQSVWQVIDAVQKEALTTIPNIRRLQIKEMGSDVMASSEAPVTILVTGKDLNILSKLAAQVADVARRTPGALQVSTSWAVEKPTYRLDVDPRRAAEVGLTPSDVADQAYYAMGGALADEFYRLPNIRQDTINIRYQADQRKSVYDLLQMPITTMNSSGNVPGASSQVPLKTLATVTPELAPTIIEHDGLRRTVSVLAYYRKDGPPSMDLAMSIITKASSELNFPPGYSLEMRGDMTQMMDSFARLLRGLELAVLLIFLVLIAQFGGLLAPLQMVLSIPLELSGVFLGLFLAHQAFSTVSIMAVIVLTGMDITTAILLIDQIQRRRKESELPRDEAIALACRDRLRPILMTSLITIVTMLPVALAPRMGIDAYQPLGTVIVAGLIVGTLLSLLVIPVMHAVVDDLNNAIARLRRTGHGDSGGESKQENAITTTMSLLLLVSILTMGLPRTASAIGTDGPPEVAAALPDLPTVSESITLKDAVALALRNSQDIKAAQSDVNSADAAIGSAVAARRPTLSTTTYLTTGDSSNILTSSPGVMPQNIFGVSSRPLADQNLMFMVPISTGGRLEANIATAKRQGEATAAAVTAAHVSVAENVTEAYARALLGQALVEAAQARKTAEDEQVRVTGEKVTAGRLAPVDLLREQAEQADAGRDVLEAQNSASIAYVELKTAMGVSQASTLDLADTFDSLASFVSVGLPNSLDDALREAKKQRPELVAALLQIAAARSGVSAAKGAYSPQIYGVAMADGTLSREMSGGRAGYTIGFTASLPILDGGQRRSDMDTAKARLARATADAQKVRQAIEQEVTTAWLSYSSATARTASAQAGVTAAEKGYELANLRYNAGKSITAERLDSLSALTRARTALARSKADSVIACAKLRASVGG